LVRGTCLVMGRERRRVNTEGKVSRRSDGRYSGYITVPTLTGESERRWVDSKDEAEATAKLEQLRRELDAPGIPPGSAPVTFEVYTAEWLRVKSQHIARRTYQVYERELRALVFPYLGEMPLVSIKPKHIRDMQIEIAEDIGAASAQHARKHALAVLNMAVADELIHRNPAQFVKPVRKDHQEVEIWNADEIRAFLEAARGHPYYALFYLALMTGLRPGELCALEWNCVFEDRIYVKQTVTRDDHRLEIGQPKTRAGRRYVPLPKDAREVLDRYAPLKRTGYVFPTEKGTVLNFSNVRMRWFLPILEDAGLKKIKPYIMRHTFASMQIKKGVDAPTLAKWMGHTDSGFTLKYYVKAFERCGQITSYTLDELLEDELPGSAKPQEVPSEGQRLRPGGNDAALAVRVSSQELADLLSRANGKDVALKLVIED